MLVVDFEGGVNDSSVNDALPPKEVFAFGCPLRLNQFRALGTTATLLRRLFKRPELLSSYHMCFCGRTVL